MNNKRGSIVVIKGSMFSGKTDELVRRLERESYRPGGKSQAFKPAFDTRYADEHIVTHNQKQFPCTVFSSVRSLLDIVDPDTTLVGIDEAQFSDPTHPEELYTVCILLAKSGRDVWLSCLSQDYRGEPFKNVAYVLAVANKVIEKTAVCSVCGSDEAMYSQLLETGHTDQLLLGAKGRYDARCAQCFVPAP